jgi:hypothetical protein
MTNRLTAIEQLINNGLSNAIPMIEGTAQEITESE